MASSSNPNPDAPLTRKRTRTRMPAPPPPPPPQAPAPPSDFSLYFPDSAAQREQFKENLLGKDVIEPKYLDADFFTSAGFDICNTLSAIHLQKFAELHCPFAITLVKAFYQNLTFSSDPFALRTRIKGVDITVTADDWIQLYDYHGDGTESFDGVDYHHFDRYDQTLFIPTILRPGVIIPTETMFTATLLTVPHRILHYLISHTLLPRGGNHAKLFNTDLFMMWAILNQEPIYWPATFCRVMMKAKRSSTVLPFPMLIQKIMELKGVPMEGEVMTELKINHRFDSTALKKAHIHKVHGQWVWEDRILAQHLAPVAPAAPAPDAPAAPAPDAPAVPAASDAPAGAAGDAPLDEADPTTSIIPASSRPGSSRPASSAPASNASLATMISRLGTRIENNFKDFRAEMRAMETRLEDRIDTGFRELRSELGLAPQRTVPAPETPAPDPPAQT